MFGADELAAIIAERDRGENIDEQVRDLLNRIMEPYHMDSISEAEQTRANADRVCYESVRADESGFLSKWQRAIQTAEINEVLQILQHICNHYRRTKIASIKTFVTILIDNMGAIYDARNTSSGNIFFRYALQKKTEVVESLNNDLSCNISHALMTLPVYVMYNGNNNREDQSSFDLYFLLNWFLRNLNSIRSFQHPFTGRPIMELSQIAIDFEQYATIKRMTQMDRWEVLVEVVKDTITGDFRRFCADEYKLDISNIPDRSDVLNRMSGMHRRIANAVSNSLSNYDLKRSLLFLLHVQMVIIGSILEQKTKQQRPNLSISETLLLAGFVALVLDYFRSDSTLARYGAVAGAVATVSAGVVAGATVAAATVAAAVPLLFTQPQRLSAVRNQEHVLAPVRQRMAVT